MNEQHTCSHDGEASCARPLSEQVNGILHQAEQLCKERHLRFTDTRRRVLELLCRASQPVGAYALLDELKSDGMSAAPPTVYRALDFLIENGLIHRLATSNTYLVCAHPRMNHEGLFLLCDVCGETKEIHTSGVMDAIESNATAQGFHVRHAAIEVSGVCQQCGGSDAS